MGNDFWLILNHSFDGVFRVHRPHTGFQIRILIQTGLNLSENILIKQLFIEHPLTNWH